MGSVTCERCGFVSFATSEVCKQCGSPLPGPQAALNWRPQPNLQPTGAPDRQPQAYAGNWPPAQGWPPPPHGDSAHYQSQPSYYGTDDGLPKRKGLAVVSLLCGLLALPVMIVGAVAAVRLGAPAAILGSVAGLVLTLLALALGIAGTVRVNKNPAEFGGKGMAVAGIILGSLLLVSVVPVGVIASIAIPNLLAARRASNEASAIGALRRISSAQATYVSAVGESESYGSMEELIDNSLLEPQMRTGTKNGYRFEVEASGDSFVATATPLSYPDTGKRSYFVSESGVIRGADKAGMVADEEDPPVGSDDFAGSPAHGGEGVEWTENGPAVRRAGPQSYGRR
ncbi:MAG TPA: hypothetical protein VK421_09365 [Pyrinomonadaceae bacterium]|nr:hypothetical protein [Pyrinomonadaceae bacterium]